MPTIEEIRKALKVLEVIEDEGTLSVYAAPRLGQLKVIDLCIGRSHGGIGINITVDAEGLLEGKE